MCGGGGTIARTTALLGGATADLDQHQRRRDQARERCTQLLVANQNTVITAEHVAQRLGEVCVCSAAYVDDAVGCLLTRVRWWWWWWLGGGARRNGVR